MEKPDETLTEPNEYNANDLSISFASLLPTGPDQVGVFLTDAAFALGCKEADLARLMGVSRATLSGWKARGSIPKEHTRWFVNEFSWRVIFNFRLSKNEDYRHVGLEVALHLFDITNFNPFRLENRSKGDLLHKAYWHLGGLARFCFFVLHRLPLDQSTPLEERAGEAAKVASSIIAAVARGRLHLLSQ